MDFEKLLVQSAHQSLFPRVWEKKGGGHVFTPSHTRFMELTDKKRGGVIVEAHAANLALVQTEKVVEGQFTLLEMRTWSPYWRATDFQHFWEKWPYSDYSVSDFRNSKLARDV